MTSLSVIIFACLPLVTIGWMSCPQSIPTVSFVSRCPSDAKEWMMAAGKKDCGAMEKHQNCSNDGSFVYHCVLNEDATKLLEVCAPIWYMSGYCARFSVSNKRLVNNPGLDCTKFVPPCPARFPSNESFKYQMCYQNLTLFDDTMPIENPKRSPQPLHNEQEQSNGSVLVVFLAIFVLTTICLGILLIFWKMKGFLTFGAADTTQGDLNEDTGQGGLIEDTRQETEDGVMEMRLLGVDSDNDPEDEFKKRIEDAEKTTELTTMSGRKVSISLKDVKNVGDLRHILSKKLEIGKELLWIVDKDNGTLYQEDTKINAEKSSIYTLMKGNKNRESSLKRLMKCGHFTGEETLFELVRDTLPETEYTELKCPLCSTVWEKDDVIEICNMSEDEKEFFECVLKVNQQTKKLRQLRRD